MGALVTCAKGRVCRKGDPDLFAAVCAWGGTAMRISGSNATVVPYCKRYKHTTPLFATPLLCTPPCPHTPIFHPATPAYTSPLPPPHTHTTNKHTLRVLLLTGSCLRQRRSTSSPPSSLDTPCCACLCELLSVARCCWWCCWYTATHSIVCRLLCCGS